jgi:hypothetical protein
MSVFSFTAPHITPEEEQLERDALSETERTQLHTHLFGEEGDVDEEETLPENSIKNGRELMEQAVQLLPDIVKRDYLAARDRVPQLVERESEPMAFFRREKYDETVSFIGSCWMTSMFVFSPNATFHMTLNFFMLMPFLLFWCRRQLDV